MLPISGRIDGIRIKRDDDQTVYQLNLQKIGEEASNPLSYKDKLVWNLDKSEVQKISVLQKEAPDQVMERQEDGSYLSVGTNGNLRVDSEIYTKVLDSLKQVSAASYITYNPRDLSSYGLDEPQLSLLVSLAGTNQIGRVLLVGNQTDGGHYAMVQGRDVVFLLDRSLVDRLARNWFVTEERSTSDSE